MKQVDSGEQTVTPADVEPAGGDLRAYLSPIRLLFEWEHLLAEPAGAAALAALLCHHRPAPNKRVVVILFGGNVTDEVMLRALKTR